MSDEEGSDAKPRLSGFGLLAFGALIAGVAILLVGTHNKNEAPFTALQVHPKLVGLRVLTPSDARGSNVTAALRRLGGSAANGFEIPGAHRDWQYVVGRVDVDAMPASDAEYEVIVVDNRLHRVASQTYSFPRPQQSAGTGQGWDNAADSLRERFDWKRSGSDQDAFFKAGSTNSFPFVARLPADANPVTDPSADVTVVLALTHDSDHVYWAVKLN